MPGKSAIRCSARFHLRGSLFSVYDAARQLTARSREKGEHAVCSASRRTLAFMCGYAEGTIAVARAELVSSGWFVPVSKSWIEDQRKTGRAGSFRTPEFLVIEHDDWSVANPGRCCSDATVSTFTAHGKTANVQSVYGNSTNTVRGRVAVTVCGKTAHKALLVSLERKPKGKAAASAACDPFEDTTTPTVDDIRPPDYVPRKKTT